MIYTEKRTLQQRYYDRICDLFAAPSFKGVNLGKKNPLGLKRNDEIPVTGATFDDGTNITVSLKSDNSHYFFHVEVTGSGSNIHSDTSANPFSHEGGTKWADFSAYDPDSRAHYQIELQCVDDHIAILTIETVTQNVPLYVGPVQELPELTHEYLSQAIADKVMEKFELKMPAMADFLLNAKNLILEERRTADDSSWVKRTMYDTHSTMPHIGKAIEIIEKQTRWNWLACGDYSGEPD